MLSGWIYVLRNRVNGKLYVGQTTMDVQKRFDKHARMARLGRECGMPLLRAMRKYGSKAFEIVFSMHCDNLRTMDAWEIFLIAHLETRNRDIGYNVREGGSSMGEMDRARMSKAMTKVYSDPSRRVDLSIRTTKQMADPIARQYRATIASNMWTDPIKRMKMSKAISVAQNKPESKDRMRRAQQKASRNPKARRERSIWMKKFWNSGSDRVSQIKEKIRDRMRESQVRQNLSDMASKQWADPEKRQKIHTSIQVAGREQVKSKYGDKKIRICSTNGQLEILRCDLGSFCRSHKIVLGNAVKVLRGDFNKTGGYRFSWVS